jgi:hypothetical protein
MSALAITLIFRMIAVSATFFSFPAAMSASYFLLRSGLKRAAAIAGNWSVWLTRILPRRSSTAHSSDDRVHRQTPKGLWGRADLQGAADRPSTYHAHALRRGDQAERSTRAKHDAVAASARLSRIVEALSAACASIL